MAMSSPGMRSESVIRVAVRNGISRLSSSYSTPPFKVANITEDKLSDPLHLMLMCSSPGVLDGDDLSIRVELGASSRLWLHTQAYQRLFQMRTGARQSMDVLLEKGARFCWLPHPCVPHKEAIFRGTNRIFLSEDCELIWGEVLTCGRNLRGEIFAFSSYHVRTEVFINEQLVLLENMCLRPGVLPMGMLGQLEGHTHQASLLFVGGDGAGVAEKMEMYLSGLPTGDIVYGVSEGPAGSLVARLLGNKAEPLYEALQAMAGMLLCSKTSDHAS